MVGPYWKSLGEMILIRGQNICSMIHELSLELSYYTCYDGWIVNIIFISLSYNIP